MPPHPPWLRFQAYVVGLPKTGSTSVAAMFGNFRSAHEWGLMELVGLGLARERGELDDAGFWAGAGPRLTTPSLEMDSCTSHHLYVDLLAERFPQARFVVTMRDVGGWVTSLLDMVLRKRIAREFLDVPYSTWERNYLDRVTGDTYPIEPGDHGDDRNSLVPLMHYWSDHLRTMAREVPTDRALFVRTQDLAARAADLAGLVGVPAETMRHDLAHANRSPASLDRLGTFWDADLREAYLSTCADAMAEHFPDHHARLLDGPTPSLSEAERSARWAAHEESTRTWVDEAVRTHGPAAAH